MQNLLRTDRVPPALIARLRYVFTYFDPVAPGPPFLPDFESIVRQGQPWWSAAPELEALGHALIAPTSHPEMRRRGCIWLGLFPSRDMVRALRAMALSPDEPRRLRDQAVWTLGYRQLQDRNDALRWTAEVTAEADATLLEVARQPGARDELRELHGALRHVSSPAVLALFAEDPVGWSRSIECFADPPLARALLARLPDVPSEDLHRVVRLVADSLGAEACEPLLAHAKASPWSERVEVLLAALAADPDRARPDAQALMASMSDPASFGARMRWHEANPGVLPTVRALRTARITATLAASDRVDACRAASDLFASQARLAIFAEQYLYAMWRNVALRSGDPNRIVPLVDANPAAIEDSGVLAPYLEALADAGRFRKLLAAAQSRETGALTAWLLATRGRPFLALAVRAADRGASPMGIAAQALALFLAGRPDLAKLTLVEEPPRPEVIAGDDTPMSFPGPDEAWRIDHDRGGSLPLTALMAGIDGLLGCARGAPETGDPDGFDPSLLATFARSLRRELKGATVFVAGEVEDRAGLERALSDRGARVAAAPFAGVDYYVAGRTVSVTLLAKLERQGARRIGDPRATEAAS